MIRRFVVPPTHQSSNPRFDKYMSYIFGIFFSLGGDILVVLVFGRCSWGKDVHECFHRDNCILAFTFILCFSNKNIDAMNKWACFNGLQSLKMLKHFATELKSTKLYMKVFVSYCTRRVYGVIF
jgi:hypothetical protein